MTHNEFQFYDDIIDPLQSFLAKINYRVNLSSKNLYDFKSETNKKYEMIKNSTLKTYN